MSAALESSVDATIDALCNPTAADGEVQDEQHDAGPRALEQKQAVSEIQPASPRERRESITSAMWENEGDFDWEDGTATQHERPTVWYQTMQKILQQCVVAAVVLVILWTQGKLPIQLRQLDRANVDNFRK